MVYVYILRCKNGSLYTGYAVDVKNRLAVHESGKGAKYTRGKGPFELCYVEICLDKSSALKREVEIKALSRFKKEELIQAQCVLHRNQSDMS